jgi:hypothetical protein
MAAMRSRAFGPHARIVGWAESRKRDDRQIEELLEQTQGQRRGLAWSTVHGASLLWLDGPMHGGSTPAAKKAFLALSGAAIRRLARSIARSTR